MKLDRQFLYLFQPKHNKAQNIKMLFKNRMHARVNIFRTYGAWGQMVFRTYGACGQMVLRTKVVLGQMVLRTNVVLGQMVLRTNVVLGQMSWGQMVFRTNVVRTSFVRTNVSAPNNTSTVWRWHFRHFDSLVVTLRLFGGDNVCYRPLPTVTLTSSLWYLRLFGLRLFG